jgi:hypothetical protein
VVAVLVLVTVVELVAVEGTEVPIVLMVPVLVVKLAVVFVVSGDTEEPGVLVLCVPRVDGAENVLFDRAIVHTGWPVVGVCVTDVVPTLLVDD